MATKINTNFVIILVLAIVCGTGIVGALYYLSIRGDVGRSIRRGDEAMQAGDLKRAFNYYGRAVDKEPGNPAHLAKMEDALLRMQPETADEARELYSQRVGILRHAARHNYNDAAAHLRVLDELLGAARRLNASQLWDTLASAAADMLQQLPESNPERIRARVYRAHAMFRLATLRTSSELTEALRDMDEVIKALPNDDLGWATLVLGQIVLVEKLRIDGAVEAVIDEQVQKMFETAARAREAVPDGPETARILAFCTLFKASTQPGSVSDQDMSNEVARLDRLITVDTDPANVSESAEVLSLMPGGYETGQRLLERYLDAHPEAHDKRIALAVRQYQRGELDDAERSARAVLDAPLMTVSFWASLQFELRRQAASLIVDVEHRRWELADAAEKTARLAATEAAREQLLKVVVDTNNDPAVIRADGKIAYAKEQYGKAAGLFERLVGTNDPEVLLYAASCLHRVGQLGLAYERLAAASASIPGHQDWQVMKAALEVDLGRLEQAEETLASLSAEVQNQPRVRQIRESMERQRRSTSVDNPVRTALQSADAALARRDYDAARSALEAFQTTPNAEIIAALARIEISAGNREAAQAHVARGVEAFPEIVAFRNLKTSLAHEDPIEGVRALLEATISDPAERRVSYLVHMIAMNENQERLASQLEREGRTADAGKARDLANRSAAQRDRLIQETQEGTPNHPVLVDIQFVSAVKDKDWARAEQVVARAKQLNADQAGGDYYRGRLEVLRGNLKEAVRAFEAATQRAGYLALLWRDLGLVYQSLGNLSQAQRAFEQAYRCNPNDLSIVRSYVNVLQLRGEGPQARAILQTAHQLAPNNTVVRELWLTAETTTGNTQTALRTRRDLYKTMTADDERLSREDLVNATQLAKLLGQTEPTRILLLDGAGNPIYSEQRWVRMEAGERDAIIARAKTEWQAEAKTILDRLEQDVAAGRVRPDVVRDSDLELSLAYERASLLRVTGKIVEGERVLQEFIARRGSEKTTVAMLMALARYQADVNHFSDAVATYKEALSRQDPEQREVDSALGELYMRLNMPAEALPHLEALYAARKEPNTKNHIIACLIDMGRLDDADRNIRELLQADAANLITVMLEASLAEAQANELLARGETAAAERKYAQQRDALSRAEAQDPTNPTPHVQLARSLYREYLQTRRETLLQDSLAELDRAERLRPGIAEVALTRTQVLLAKGDRTSAINELRRVLERQPDNIPARRELIGQYVSARDGEAAMRTVEEGIRSNPTLAIWHDVKGDVHKVFPEMRDTRAAFESYAEADRLEPSAMSLLKVVDVLIAGKVAENCADAVRRLEARPTEVDAMPVLRQYYARALLCSDRREDAIEQARLAYAARRKFNAENNVDPGDILEWFTLVYQLFPLNDPSAAEAFVMDLCGQSPDLHVFRGLSRIWWNSGATGLNQAIEFQRQAVAQLGAENDKTKAQVNLELAHYLLAAQNMAEAAAVYETVVRLEPRHSSALNNLAYIWAEDLKDPQKALGYAERVLPLAPNDPSVLDTVGWTYYRAGNLEKAKEYLNQSLTLQASAGTHAHLAHVHWSAGDAAEARRHIDAAAGLKPDPATKQKLDRLADDIQQGRKP